MQSARWSLMCRTMFCTLSPAVSGTLWLTLRSRVRTSKPRLVLTAREEWKRLMPEHSVGM